MILMILPFKVTATAKPSTQNIQAHLDRNQHLQQHEMTITINPTPNQAQQQSQSPVTPIEQPKSTLCHITVHKKLRVSKNSAYQNSKIFF